MGQTEIFADNLPKVPDNIRLSKNGGYWVALSGPVRSAEDLLTLSDFMGRRPWLRKQIAKVGL